MACEFFGATKRELKAKHLLDLYTSDNFELVSRMVPTPDGKGGKVRHQEVKVKRADGSVAEVEINSNLLYNTDGKVIGTLTIQRDITSRKKAEEKLRESEERYRTIFQTAEVGLVELDYSELKSTLEKLKKEGIENWRVYLETNPELVEQAGEKVKIIDANEATLKLAKAKSKDELPRTIQKFFGPRSQKQVREIIVAIAEGKNSFSGEAVLYNLQGEPVYVLLNLTIPAPEAKFKNLLVSLVDITQRKKIEEEKDLLLNKLHELNKQLETLAITDGLTKLYNYRFFMENLNREFSRAKRLGQPLSLLMADIDNFKSFNDTYGHQLGDEILAKVAEILKSSRRGSDIVARYGGEEFVLLLPDTSLDKAMILAEKLRKKVENTFIRAGRQNLRVTISLGVAGLENNNLKKTQELLKMTDKALYLAKKAGKNKVCSVQTGAVA